MKPSSRLFVFRFRNFLEANIVTVVNICTDHRVCTYGLPALTEPSTQVRRQSRTISPDRDTAGPPQRRRSKAEPAKDSGTLEGRKGYECLFHPSKSCLTYQLCVFSRGAGAAPPGGSSGGDKAGRSAGREAPKGCRESGTSSRQDKKEEAKMGPAVSVSPYNSPQGSS